MTRKLKALGLALVAVFALCAMAAQGASADVFTTSTTTTVSGTSSDNVFKITGAGLELKCARAAFTSTAIANGATSATVFPTYNGTLVETGSVHCGTNGLGTITWDINGCDYDLTGNTSGLDNGLKDATVSITCPTGKEIVMTNSLCNIKIHAQTSTSGGVSYDNEAGGKVKVTMTMTGITYATEGAFCPLGGFPTEANDADLNGSVLLTPAAGTISVSGS